MKTLNYYLAVTNDEYELPLAVFTKARDMCEWLGISEYNLSHCLNRVNRKYNCKIIRIVGE